MRALAMGTHEQRRRNLMKKRATADGKLNKKRNKTKTKHEQEHDKNQKPKQHMNKNKDKEQSW